MKFFLSVSLFLAITYTLFTLPGCNGEIEGPPPPGPAWVTFTASSSPLPSNTVNQVYVDRELRVWFATNEGAAYFKDNSWGIIRDSLKYFIYDNGGTQIPAYNVTSITQGKDRSIWFGLRGGGVVRYNQYSQNGNTWNRYLNSEFISSLSADISDATANGEMWIVTGGGLNRFVLNSTDGGVWHYYQTPQIPSNQNTVAVRSPFDNSIWIGSASNGMLFISYDPFFAISNIPLPAGYIGKITGIAFDGNQNVWISKDIGISAVNLESGIWTHYTNANTNGKLPPGNVNAVASDLGSNRWFGTDSGLVHLVDTTWSRFTTANSPLPNNTVMSLSYDQRGNLWIGTRGGAAAYRPEGTRF